MRTRYLGIALLVVALFGPSLADAAVLPAAQTLFVADKAGKHPKRMTLKVPLAVSLSGKVAACVEYGHSLEGESGGKITVKVKILRDGSAVARASFKGKVKDSHYDGCVDVSVGLAENDLVEFDFVYRKFSRLSRGDGFVAIAGLIPQ